DLEANADRLASRREGQQDRLAQQGLGARIPGRTRGGQDKLAARDFTMPSPVFFGRAEIVLHEHVGGRRVLSERGSDETGHQGKSAGEFFRGSIHNLVTDFIWGGDMALMAYQ